MGAAVAREAWIDWAKALAIIAVVWIHAVAPAVAPRLTIAAVPCFFFVSGYTLARSEVTWRRIGQRLSRLLVPYLVASVGVIAWTRPGFRTAASMLVAGWALGIYYFVPMLCVALVAVGAALMLPARYRVAALAILIAGTIASIGGHDLIARHLYPRYPGLLFGLMRSPQRWAGYVAAGAMLAGLIRPRYARAPDLIERLSANTLPIYLYHYMLVAAAKHGTPVPLLVSIGVIGPWAIAEEIRRTCPRLARFVG